MELGIHYKPSTEGLLKKEVFLVAWWAWVSICVEFNMFSLFPCSFRLGYLVYIHLEKACRYKRTGYIYAKLPYGVNMCVHAALCWTGTLFKVSPWSMPSVTKNSSGSTVMLTKAVTSHDIWMNEWMKNVFCKTKRSTSIISSSSIMLLGLMTHLSGERGHTLDPWIDQWSLNFTDSTFVERKTFIIRFLTRPLRVSSLDHTK